MMPKGPFFVGEGLREGEQLPHSWFVKDKDGNTIMEGFGSNLSDAQQDLVAKLKADGWTDTHINEAFDTFIKKGTWQKLP